MLAADAARRASATEVVAIMPYYGYARQDKKEGLRGCVGAKVVANMLIGNGVNRVMVVDFHAEQIQGFFNMPVDHISGHRFFTHEITTMIRLGDLKNLTIVSPDAGGVHRAQKFQKRLIKKHDDIQFAMLNKIRIKPNEVARMDLIGDVKGGDVLIIDDMVDTAGTLCKAAAIIHEAGAASVRAMCTHGVLSGEAQSRIKESVLTELIIADTLPLTFESTGKIRQVSCAKEIARMMMAVINKQSAEELYTV